MAGYVDGFVLPVPKKSVPAYLRLAKSAGKIWLKHGALEYRECVGDDLGTNCGVAFPTQFAAKRGETIFFSWIVYKSRAHRDSVNAKVMKDPRMGEMMSSMKMPFDVARMSMGGFKISVDM